MTSEISYSGTLEYEDIERTLKAIAAEKPEYVYIPPSHSDGSCVYSTLEGSGGAFGTENTITPSCIVGHLVYRLFGEFALRQLNWHCNQGGWESAFGALRIRIVGNRAGHLLNVAQSLQDQKVPWGRAVSEAIRIANEFDTYELYAVEVPTAIREAHVAYEREKVDAQMAENSADNPGTVSDS